MKKEIRIFRFLDCILKKIFFNNVKTDFYHECKREVNDHVGENEKEIEEYLKNYQSTTRWQTL